MSDEEALTFSELRKIQKTERRQEELSELEQNFFLKVRDYLERKKDIDENSREYKNAKRIFRKILSLREDKIVKNARLSLKSNIKALELNMLPREEELFRDMKKQFHTHRDRVEEVTEGQAIESKNTEPGIQESAEKRREEAKVEVPENDSETEDVDEESDNEEEENNEHKHNAAEGYEIVEITSEVPEFMGTDLEAYGPFEEGEEAEIPEDNAEILVNRGNAEQLS
jgi:DNA replication initiation complex subunit (GINS family)